MRPEDVRRMLAHEGPGNDAPGKPHSRIRRLALRVAILFTLYCLSIGPLYWKWYGAKSGLASPLYLILYRPLERLAELIPPLGHFLNWYIQFWIY